MTEEAPSIESSLQSKIEELERRIEKLEKNLSRPSDSTPSKKLNTEKKGDTGEAIETFEIISVDSRAFERDVEGDRCKFSWKVVVQNHTSRPLILSSRLEFVDMDSYLV